MSAKRVEPRRLGRRTFVGLLVAGGAAAAAGPAGAGPLVDPQGVVGGARRMIGDMRAGRRGDLLGFYLQRAAGVMAFPRLIRAGFLVGGGGGYGVLLGRSEALGWSYPAFVGLGSGSVGLQIGVQSTRALLVIIDPATVQRALATGLRLGVDASVAVGPEGLTGEVSTQTLFEDVYAFTETEGGLFVGASLEGSVIAPAAGLNEAYYGEKVAPADIVLDRLVWNPGAESLRDALA
jgi:SH3 domain-containing YSC84-like protein 1